MRVVFVLQTLELATHFKIFRFCDIFLQILKQLSAALDTAPEFSEY